MPLEVAKDGAPGVDPALVRTRVVAIVGFGNQGHAHAANLRDNGVRVLVGARRDSPSGARAQSEGFEVSSVADVARRSDVVMLLAPDEAQGKIYREELAANLRPGAAIAFGHGFSIRFGTVEPETDVDVILVAPVGPGKLLRSRFVEGSGIPSLIAVHNDATKTARALALSYAAALGSGRAGIIETTFAAECETDLFGEQAVIVGGVSRLITAGFETLVEAGYPEELAYFECAHQMKLLVDLIHERGISGMREAISNTARYGDLTRGPRVVDETVKDAMRQVLREVQTGTFAKEWIAETAAGKPKLAALEADGRAHDIEKVGERLRKISLGDKPR